MKKMIYIMLGFVGLGLGALGTMVPLIPTVPFLLLATACFGKSSERLHTWFIGTKLYRENLESFVAGKGMTWRMKRRIMTVVTLTMLIGFILMQNVPVGRIVLTCVWIFHVLYFCFGIKNLSEEEYRSFRGRKVFE